MIKIEYDDSEMVSVRQSVLRGGEESISPSLYQGLMKGKLDKKSHIGRESNPSQRHLGKIHGHFLSMHRLN